MSVVEAAARAGSVWRNPAYVRLWTSETLSRFGEPFAQVGIPIVAVLILSATPVEVGLLDGAAGVAFLVIGLPVGAWIDRRAKRTVMMRSTLVRAATLVCIPVLWWTHALAIWQLFAIAAIVGGASVFYDVAYQSYVPAIVPMNQVAAANAGVETSNQIAQVAGPALAGAILAVARAPVMLLITAIGYVVSFVALAGIREREVIHASEIRQSIRTEISEGLRFVFGEPLLRRITIMSATSNGFGSLGATVFPIFVLRTLGLPAWAFAIIGAVGSIGGIVGALASPWLTRRLGEGRVIVAAILLGSVGWILAPAADLSHGLAVPILIAAQFIGVGGVVVYNVAQVSFRQRICPPHLLGRMNASIRFVVWGISPIAAVVAGVLGGWIGIVATMWVSGVLTVTSCAILVFSPLSTMRALPRSPAL